MNKLFDHLYAFRVGNPNGTFQLMVLRPTHAKKRLYFGALKEGFRTQCRALFVWTVVT